MPATSNVNLNCYANNSLLLSNCKLPLQVPGWSYDALEPEEAQLGYFK